MMDIPSPRTVSQERIPIFQPEDFGDPGDDLIVSSTGRTSGRRKSCGMNNGRVVSQQTILKKHYQKKRAAEVACPLFLNFQDLYAGL